MELDYLRSEAIHANLDKLGMWEPFMDKNRFDAMTQIWKDVDLKLRGACAALIAPPRDATASDVDGPVSDIVVQLKRIHEEVRPFNAELGQKIAREMEAVFKDGKRASASQGGERNSATGVIEGTKN